MCLSRGDVRYVTVIPFVFTNQSLIKIPDRLDGFRLVDSIGSTIHDEESIVVIKRHSNNTGWEHYRFWRAVGPHFLPPTQPTPTHKTQNTHTSYP